MQLRVALRYHETWLAASRVHVLNSHSNDEQPVRLTDFNLIAEVVREGEIVGANYTDQGHPAIEYREAIHGNWLYVVSEVHKIGKKPPGTSMV